jgi:DNA ligase 1
MSDPCQYVISSLETHSSRLDKEAIILVQAEAGNTEFFEGCRLALDSMITFGVKKVPEAKDSGPGLSWDQFKAGATKLSNREATGHAAQDLIEGLMVLATREQWNGWYRRILIKDLRCGTSEKTINKVVEKDYENYIIPVFSCQLAHDSANHESKVAGEKLIEVKLDGVRVITIVYPSGHVSLFSRNGKQLDNFPHIVEQISAVVKKVAPPFPLVLDGEVMSSSFQDLMKQVHRKSDVQSTDAVLNLFDMIPLEHFEKGSWDRPQIERSQMIQAWIKTHKADLPNVDSLSFEKVDLNDPIGYNRFKEINAQAVAGGYEGIMIKDPNAPYECKRSSAWLKLKPFIEVSLGVVAVDEGTGRNIDKLGALVCEGRDDDKHIRVNVGSGFTDIQRDIFWNSRSDLVDQIVEVRADAITQNQDGSYSLRFPRFLKFRGFEPGEKI